MEKTSPSGLRLYSRIRSRERPYPPMLKYLLLPFVIVGRLLFWILFAIAGWLLVRHLKRLQDRPAPPPSSPQAGKGGVERMLPCARCGVCLPESEGVSGGGEFYCCDDHRRAGR